MPIMTMNSSPSPVPLHASWPASDLTNMICAICKSQHLTDPCYKVTQSSCCSTAQVMQRLLHHRLHACQALAASPTLLRMHHQCYDTVI